jgi:hypothetical protein
MTQVVGPDFKPQNHKNKTKKKIERRKTRMNPIVLESNWGYCRNCDVYLCTDNRQPVIELNKDV